MTSDTAFSFTVTCPKGGHPMRYVQGADPSGWANRERRAVLECTVPHCRHTVVVEVHLIDVTIPGGRPMKEAS